MTALTAIDTALDSAHYQHLIEEGFTPKQIWEMEEFGVRSMTKKEALELNLKIYSQSQGKFVSSSGLYFPFTPSFGQIRCDETLMRKGKPVKYITPFKSKSAAYLPSRWEVITEGAKDAWAGTLHGKIPTGAIAGVSHTRKALPSGCGKVFLFDSDGWSNPQVAAMLLMSALHTNGKIQLVPEMESYPKGGLCEFFKAGNDSGDYAALIKAAMTPAEFIIEWTKRWDKLPEKKRMRAVRVSTVYALTLAGVDAA